MTTTCQICARAIKANTGLIAHHGYQRPAEGWQTGSCPGARYRPYEVACDAIPPVLEGLRKLLHSAKEQHRELLLAPAELVIPARRDAWGRVQRAAVTVARPEGFDPARMVHRYVPLTYDSEFERRDQELSARAARLTHDINALQARLDAWKAPAPQGA